MAEFVQENREEMLEELEQLERLGIFEPQETRTILKKRTGYEYRLKRKAREKKDYLQYIQYEVSVMALIRKRRERLRVRQKQQEIEVAIRMRIHRLFKEACFRFQGDVKLWLSYIEWAKSKGEKSTVSKLYTRMLQVHNRKPEIWAAAAKHEMDVCKSLDNARRLLQRGLRFNSNSQELWREYFRMELLNAEILQQRKQILDDAALQADMTDEVLSGKVAEVVFNNAVTNFPGEPGFALSLLPVCRLFPFTQNLQEAIYTYCQELSPYQAYIVQVNILPQRNILLQKYRNITCLQSNHGEEEVTYDAVARRHLVDLETMETRDDITKEEKNAEICRCEDECFQVYDQAVKALQTERMYDLYLTACLERVKVSRGRKGRDKVRERSLDVFERAAECGCLSPNMAVTWLKTVRKLGDVPALEACMTRAVALHPASVPVRRQTLSYLVLLRGAEHAEVYKAFVEAVGCVPAKDSLPLWSLIHDWLILCHSKQLEQFFEFGLTQAPVICSQVKDWYLCGAAVGGDLAAVRALYRRLSTSQPVSLTFFTSYIQAENSQPEVNMKKIRSAYEDALTEYGKTTPDLWLEYMLLELRHPQGDPVKAGGLHWRAVRALEGELNEEFITQYTLMQNQKL